MCTSFDVIFDTEKLVDSFKKQGKELVVTANAAKVSPGKSRMRPTDIVPVIRRIDDEYCLDGMKWGFKLQSGITMVNSRVEEIIAGKASDYWKSLLDANPCLFVMSGYHEWKDVVIDTFTPKTGKPTKKKVKHPYRFTIKDQDTFYCAGYYRKEGEQLACTLITTKGNVITNLVHQKDRMPVIVTLDVGIQFLEATLEEKLAFCQTFPPDLMNFEPTEL
jgi:putative SOS response-associated peptidase YedK